MTKEIAEANFGTVVINGGVNDCRRNWSVDEVSEKVKSMLEQVDKAGQEARVNKKVYVNILPVPDKRGQQNADIVAVNERSNKKAKELGWSMSHIQIKLYSVVYAWHVGKAIYCCAHAVQ